MTTISFGYTIKADFHPPRGAYLDALHRALAQVSGRFDSAWMIDHLQFGDANLLEGLTSITYLAGLYPQLKFGNTVICQSFRNPALLAKMAATLQLLSGGRFILGIGAGWHEEEYRAYGYDFPPNGVRVDQLEETLQIIKVMWGGGPVSFEGQHYRIRDAYCKPRPEPLPQVIVGAHKPRMLRLAAKYGDGWNIPSCGLTRYRRVSAEFDRACAEIGRDPTSVRRSWSGGLACAATQEAAEALAGDTMSAQAEEDDFGFVGTPKQVTAQLRAFIDLGVTEFMLDFLGFPDLSCLQRVLDDVYPLLQG